MDRNCDALIDEPKTLHNIKSFQWINLRSPAVIPFSVSFRVYFICDLFTLVPLIKSDFIKHLCGEIFLSVVH